MDAIHKLGETVRRWLGPWDRMQRAVMVEIDAAVRMNEGEQDPLEASINGHIRIGVPRERSRSGGEVAARWRRARLPIHRDLNVTGTSEQSFQGTRPLVWIQLFDDQGASVTEEAFLGRGSEASRSIHARSALRMVDPSVTNGNSTIPQRKAADGQAILRGLWARLEFRTFAVAEGPRFQSEQVWMPLLPSGYQLPEIALIWVAPPLTSVPSVVTPASSTADGMPV